MSDFQTWANSLIVEWSGQESWRDNFALGAGFVLIVALLLVGAWVLTR